MKRFIMEISTPGQVVTLHIDETMFNSFAEGEPMEPVELTLTKYDADNDVEEVVSVSGRFV